MRKLKFRDVKYPIRGHTASGPPFGYQLQSSCSCWRFIRAWVMQAPAKAKGAQQGGGGGCTTQPKSFLLQRITCLPLQEVRGLRQQGLSSIFPGPAAALHTRILSDSLSPRATWLHLDWTRILEEGTFSHPSLESFHEETLKNHSQGWTEIEGHELVQKCQMAIMYDATVHPYTHNKTSPVNHKP